jgi:hypothetical protein
LIVKGLSTPTVPLETHELDDHHLLAFDVELHSLTSDVLAIPSNRGGSS